MNRASPEAQARYQAIKKVTLVGVVVNIFLAVTKIIFGFLGQSQALIADGIHSLGDLVSDLVVLWAGKHSARDADEDHPYGHGRIETVVSVLLGAMLVAIAGGILFDAVSRILEPEKLLHPSYFALIAAAVSIGANEFLFQYTITTARRIHSSMLKANAWHHRSDAISSIIALVGIAGAMMGFEFLDAVAAIGVSILIAKVGLDIGWSSLQELMDTALDPEKVEEIEKIILDVDGVLAVHSLRSRSMGGRAYVDVHLLIDNPRISVSEGHKISETVQRRLISEVDEVYDVVVHIDPEDDEVVAPSMHLPMRKQVLATLKRSCEQEKFFNEIKEVTLHYLDGKLHINILLPLRFVEEKPFLQQLSAKMQELQKNETDIARINLRFE